MRSALVTGGTGGIGSAICDMLAEKGFCIAVAYNKNEKKASEMIEKYLNRGINCIAVRADLSKKDGADKLIARLEGFPKIDTVVNSAGRTVFSQIGDMSDKDVEEVVNVNFLSPLKLIRELSKNMISRSFGRIVNITSMWGLVGASCESVYAASKAALDGLTKSLAKEFGPSGITVNSVAPGLIDTEMNRQVGEESLKEIVSSTPLERMGTPKDVASAVELLVKENSFITGTTLNVSGGFVIA